MFRTPLIGAAFLSLTLLPGCGLFFPDRPGLCQRCADRRAGHVEAAPVSYAGAPVGDGAGCGSSVIPPGGGTIYGAPTFVHPNGAIPGAETFPPPMNTPKIPRAGIEEKGKQFELESGKGPVLTIPASNLKP
jgi:hypothetical protein